MPLTTRPPTMAELENELQSGSPMVYIPLAESLRARGLLSQALEVCHRGLASGHACVAGQTLLARIHFDMGKYDLAERACRAALERAPQSVTARKLLVMTALRRRLPLRALHLLEELSQELGDDPDLIAAWMEAQRAMSERFLQDMMLTASPGNGAAAPSAPDPEETLAQIRARPEVLDCQVVLPSDTASPWGEMLNTWRQTLARVEGAGWKAHPAEGGPVRFSVLEGTIHTVLVRELGPAAGTIVVTLVRGAAFGPVKRLVDLVAAGVARDSAARHAAPSPSPDPLPREERRGESSP